MSIIDISDDDDGNGNVARIFILFHFLNICFFLWIKLIDKFL